MGILHLDLGSKKAKDVSQLLANDTARRVMDALSDDSKSESEIAKELSVPLSTVHYNVQRLVDAGLLISDEYTYSEKGKEVRHYRLASEHVIITAKPVANLASLLTGLGLTVGVAALFFVNNRLLGAEQTEEVAMMAAPVQESLAADSARMAPEPAFATADPQMWPYILVGAVAMLIGILVWHAIERYR